MSQKGETKLLFNKVATYGRPARTFLRVITWEIPFSWAIIVAACSGLYLILYNLSIKRFSTVGLFALVLDYYFREDGIPKYSQTEKNQLYFACSKLIAVKEKLIDTYYRILYFPCQSPIEFACQLGLFSSFSLSVCCSLDNLLVSYLLGLTALLMIGAYSTRAHSTWVHSEQRVI